MHDQRVSLAILAGGEGSRMGRAKGLLQVNDRPILEYLLDRFAWPGPALLITGPSRQGPPGCRRFDRECVDAVSGQGPLRGILTALEGSTTPLVIITAVDMPMVAADHLSGLVEAMGGRAGALGLMPARSVEGRRQIEPFPSIFHVEAAEVLRRRLAADLRSVARLAEQEHQFGAIDVDWEASAWLNLNQPSDLPALRQQGLHIR